MSKASLFLLLFLAFSLSGCLLFEPAKQVDKIKQEQLGENITKGVMAGIDEELLTSLARNLTKEAVIGAGEGLDSIQLDSLEQQVSQTLRTVLADVLSDSAVQAGIYTNLDSVTEILSTTVTKLVVDIQRQLLGDYTLQRLAATRDTLLGPQTQSLVDSLIQRSVRSAGTSLDKELTPKVEKLINQLGDNLQGRAKEVSDELSTAAQWLIAGVVTLLVGVFVLAYFLRKHFQKSNSRKRASQAMFKAVDGLPPEIYEQVKSEIQRVSHEQNAAKELQAMLDQTDLPNKAARKSKERKQLAEYTLNHLKSLATHEQETEIQKIAQNDAQHAEFLRSELSKPSNSQS